MATYKLDPTGSGAVYRNGEPYICGGLSGNMRAYPAYNGLVSVACNEALVLFTAAPEDVQNKDGVAFATVVDVCQYVAENFNKATGDISGLATVATSGNYQDLIDQPTDLVYESDLETPVQAFTEFEATGQTIEVEGHDIAEVKMKQTAFENLLKAISGWTNDSAKKLAGNMTWIDGEDLTIDTLKAKLRELPNWSDTPTLMLTGNLEWAPIPVMNQTQLDYPSFNITGKTETTISYAIDAVTDAENYIVEYTLSEDYDFSDAVVAYNGSNLTGTITGLASATRYIIRVKAQAAGVTDSEWGESSNILTVIPPLTFTLGTPTENSVPITITDLVERENIDAQIWYSTDNSFNTYDEIYLNQSELSSTISGLNSNTTYYIRARAYAGDNFNTSTWTATQSATTVVADNNLLSGFTYRDILTATTDGGSVPFNATDHIWDMSSRISGSNANYLPSIELPATGTSSILMHSGGVEVGTYLRASNTMGGDGRYLGYVRGNGSDPDGILYYNPANGTWNSPGVLDDDDLWGWERVEGVLSIVKYVGGVRTVIFTHNSSVSDIGNPLYITLTIYDNTQLKYLQIGGNAAII